jgi:hypothetical protein
MWRDTNKTKTSCKLNNYRSNFFAAKYPYKKDDVQQKQFLEDLSFLIVKNHLLMHLVQSQWLKKFNFHLCQKGCFAF